MSGVDFAEIGRLTADEKFEVYGLDGSSVLTATLAELKEAWQKPLRW